MRAILEVILAVLWLYMWVVFVTVIFSWLVAFNVLNTRSRAVAVVGDVLYRLTEPVLRPIRRRMPNFGGLDISPIVLWLIILLITRVIELYIYPNVF